MAFLIKKGKPHGTLICDGCNSSIGYYNNDIVSKPDRIYSRAQLNYWIKCPECGRFNCVGNRMKYSWETGNYKKLGYKDEDFPE